MSLILINTRHVGYQMKALDVRNPINALILNFRPSGCHTIDHTQFYHAKRLYFHVGLQVIFM